MEVHIPDVAENTSFEVKRRTRSSTSCCPSRSSTIFTSISNILAQYPLCARVVIVSPSLLMLSVQVIQSVLKDQRMHEQVHLIQGEMALLMDDVRTLDNRTHKLQANFGLE